MINFTRRGKYILIGLNNQQTILFHLGMSGKIIITPDIITSQVKKHEHLTLITQDGQRLSYIDPRRFGVIDLYSTAQPHPLLNRMGPEPLGNQQYQKKLIDHLHKHFASKNQSIKLALLDQHLIAGLGNIYVCEALFLAGISPLRNANSLTYSEITKIIKGIQDILTQAIEAGGSSIRDYVHSDGKKGYFQMQWQVYGKEHDICKKCLTNGKEIRIKRITQGSRSSFYCDNCQK